MTADDPKVQVYRRERGPNIFSHTFALTEDIDAEAALAGIGATSRLVAYA